MMEEISVVFTISVQAKRCFPAYAGAQISLHMRSLGAFVVQLRGIGTFRGEATLSLFCTGVYSKRKEFALP